MEDSENKEKVYQELYTEYILAVKSFKQSLVRAGIAGFIILLLIAGTMYWAIKELECHSTIPYTSVSTDVE